VCECVWGELITGLGFLGGGLVCLTRVSLCSLGTGIVNQSGHELRDLMPVS